MLAPDKSFAALMNLSASQCPVATTSSGGFEINKSLVVEHTWCVRTHLCNTSTPGFAATPTARFLGVWMLLLPCGNFFARLRSGLPLVPASAMLALLC
jgi:hypothetical protein